MLHQIIYHSRYRSGSGGISAQLRDIIAVSQRNNGRNRVTGFLIFDKTHFIQVLEGEEADVEATFERLSQDSRHESITVIERRAVDNRQFTDWSMGGSVRSPDMQHIYHRYGFGPDADLTGADPDAVVALAQEIAQFETERARTRGLSGY